MKRSLLLVVAGVALTVALAGCGGGGGGGGSVDTTTTTTSATTTTLPSTTTTTVPSTGGVYPGSYSGTFTGSPYHFDAWQMTVASDGVISGHTNNDQTDGYFTTTINSNGTFQASQSSGTNYTVLLSGTVYANGTVSGTWADQKYPAKTGSFSGTKATIPATRFVDMNNGTMRDAATNLLWLKNANSFSNLTWDAASATVAALHSGLNGLTDGSTAGQWRLPTRGELESLIYNRDVSQELSGDDLAMALLLAGYSNVMDFYWTNTPYAFLSTAAWYVNMTNGMVYYTDKTSTCYVWAVRSP